MAAAVAPILDRIRIQLGRRAAAFAPEALAGHDVAGMATQLFGMLRNTLPDRAVAVEDARATLLYFPDADVAAALESLRRAGLVEDAGPGRLRPTAAAGAVHGAFSTHMDEVVRELWAAHPAAVDVLDGPTARLVDAALTTAGPALRVLAPVYEPEGWSRAMRVAERLTPLRFHRFDAHAAAWRAAGLTVDEAKALTAGPERDAIEAETNRLAAAPYEALTPDERFTLVAALGSLPS